MYNPGKLAFEKLTATATDPDAQWHSKQFADQIHTIMKVPKVQQQVKHVMEQLDSIVSDPVLQDDVNRLVEGIDALRELAARDDLENPDFLEFAELISEPVEAIMQDPLLQQSSKLLGERVQSMMKDSTVQQHAKMAIENPVFQKTTETFAELMDPMLSEAINGEQMEVAKTKKFKTLRRGMRKFLLPPSRTWGMKQKLGQVQTSGARAPASQMGAGGAPAILEDDIGMLPPLGRWDPLKIQEEGPERYRRFVEMEIKHGRLAMAGFLGAITTYSGLRFPGYLSTSENIKFADMPGGPIASWAALPTAGWIQIIVFIALCETVIYKQDPDLEPGDVAPEGYPWVRYDDEEQRLFKLNVERQNGRAAMVGIIGMLIHEALTGNPVFPIGEF